MNAVSLSVVIVTWDGRELLRECLRALAAPGVLPAAAEVLVADNGSRDGTADWLRREHPAVRLLELGDNFGFAAANNRAAAVAAGEWLLLLNNDAAPDPGLADGLLAQARAHGADAVAARIRDWNGDGIEWGGGDINLAGYGFARSSWHPGFLECDDGASLPFACGAAMAVRRDRFLALGGFDPDYFAYYEDVDFGYRLNLAGGRLVYARSASVRHRGHATAVRHSQRWRHFHWYKNTLLTLVKNADADSFAARLAAGLALLFSRVSSLHGEATSARARGETQAAGRLLEAAAGAAEGLAFVLERWDQALAKRAAVQRMRALPDLDLARRFGGWPAEFGPDVAAWPENALAARLFRVLSTTPTLLPEALDVEAAHRLANADHAALLAENERLRALVAAMHDSWSWRATAPLRVVLDRLRGG